jgi:hypothetical protein
MGCTQAQAVASSLRGPGRSALRVLAYSSQFQISTTPLLMRSLQPLASHDDLYITCGIERD